MTTYAHIFSFFITMIFFLDTFHGGDVGLSDMSFKIPLNILNTDILM